MSKDNTLIGIDLGGTNIKGVLTDEHGHVIQEISRPTNDVPDTNQSKVWSSTVKDILMMLEERNGGKSDAIGISVPGPVNEERSAVLSVGTKMLGIKDLNWSDYLQRNVEVINDAHAALFAESQLGAGRKYQNIVMLTLGTGVGGGILLDGQLLLGQYGRAGHVGHMSIQEHHIRGIVNTPGNLEMAIGECTIRDRSYNMYQSTKALVEAHKAGSSFATWVWLKSVESLARGIVSLLNVLSPEIVILGGGIAKSGEALMDPLTEFMQVYEWRPTEESTPIVLAELEHLAGAIGAALYALHKTKS